VDENALATGIALVAASAEPANRDAIADCEIIDARSEFGNRSGDFMSRRQRPRHARKFTRDEMSVSAANATGAYLMRASPRPGAGVSTSASSNGAPADCT